MKKAGLGILTVLFVASTAALAEEPARWLHLRVVETGKNGETVRVNVPIELAEKVLPAIHTHELQDGKVKVKGEVNGVDLRQLFDAVRNTPDNEFVTVEKADENVRIAKEKGFLVVKVRHPKASDEDVDVKVPMPVVEALLSAGNGELDLVAGLRALKAFGDIELLTVKGKDQTVRVWVDSSNTAK